MLLIGDVSVFTQRNLLGLVGHFDLCQGETEDIAWRRTLSRFHSCIDEFVVNSKDLDNSNDGELLSSSDFYRLISSDSNIQALRDRFHV